MFKLIGIPFRDARGVHQKSIEKCTIDNIFFKNIPKVLITFGSLTS